MLTRQDWLLLFVGLPGEQFLTDQIRVMKGMFLLSKEGPSPLRDLFTFEPYDYGPFDADIYRDLDGLEAQGFLRSRSASGGNRRVFELTTAGEQRIAELAPQAPAPALSALQDAKMLVTSLSFTELLRYVYDRHPEYAVRSKANL